MEKILFIAKINQVVKELNTVLTQDYRVQLCSYNADTVMSMMEVVEPDLVLISLIGAADLDTSVYSSIHLQYPETPVFTIGDKTEIKRFARYYEMDQFENLERPISGVEIEEAISKRLHRDDDNGSEINPKNPPPGSRLLPGQQARNGLPQTPNQRNGLPQTPGMRNGLPQTPGQRNGLPDVQVPGTRLGTGMSMKMSMEDALRTSQEPEEEADIRKHILVVDDNAGTLRSIKNMLEDTYSVSVVPSGIKAVAMIGKRRPDLILLDYEMPVVDGRQTLEMIHAEEEFADIPVLFLTSVNDREQIKAVLSLNPAGYLLKPPNQKVLKDAIEKALWK